MRALFLTAALMALSGCDEEDPIGANDAAPVEQADGAICPPPLGVATARPLARPPAGPLDDQLRMNHLQAKATHNSYHLQKYPDSPAEWAYAHQPIDVQLESQGVRGFEIDLHWVPECKQHEVFHIPVVDDSSSCRRLTDCLALIRKWSDGHLGHHPLFVQIEPKNDGAQQAETRATTIEQEILSVFPRDAVITPDEVKGSAPSLREGIKSNGWPTLGKTRGRILFYLLASGAPGNLRDVYTHGSRDLDGRLMFVSSAPGDPFASVAVIDDPVANRAAVDTAVAAGMIVRTFAEKDNGKTILATDALASGAQIIATDYPAPVASTTWVFQNPGTPSRCNVVTRPSDCSSEDIESSTRLATP